MKNIKQNSVFNRILPELVLRLDATPCSAYEFKTSDGYDQKQNSWMSGVDVARQNSLPCLVNWVPLRGGDGGREEKKNKGPCFATELHIKNKKPPESRQCMALD